MGEVKMTPDYERGYMAAMNGEAIDLYNNSADSEYAQGFDAALDLMFGQE
jgi:hypothetical protein